MSYDVWHQFLVKFWFFQIIEYSCERKRKQKQPATALIDVKENVRRKSETETFVFNVILNLNDVIINIILWLLI
jgi:hypothetical protein